MAITGVPSSLGTSPRRTLLESALRNDQPGWRGNLGHQLTLGEGGLMELLHLVFLLLICYVLLWFPFFFISVQHFFWKQRPDDVSQHGFGPFVDGPGLRAAGRWVLRGSPQSWRWSSEVEPFEARPLSVSTRLPLRADRLLRSAELQPLKHILHTVKLHGSFCRSYLFRC